MSAPALALLLALGPSPAAERAMEGDWAAPTEEKARVNPIAASDRDVARGRSLYRQHCELCHGREGRGDGPSAKLHARNARPPQDLTRPEIQAKITDGEIFWKISTGFRENRKIVMPAFVDEIPSAEDRWRVVLYVRTLERQAVTP
jgi:mono/diheme cytochrome c family protein